MAKGKSLTMIFPLILVFVINAFYPLGGKEGFVVLLCMGVTVVCALVMYKAGIIKMTLKSELKARKKN